jgi:8-oxo-dGTP pyrophosphatase MutT (NUDIX family)
MGSQPRRRDSARVIVINSDGHVLLLRADDPHTDHPPCWITPGGGVEPGEELLAAACRELLEETGHTVEPSALIGPVAVAEGPAEFRGEALYITDTYFAVVVDDDFTFDHGANVDAIEAEIINDCAWFAPEQCETWHETVYPKGLAQLVRDVHAMVVFAEPRTLEW